jgi:hypothetical protein
MSGMPKPDPDTLKRTLKRVTEEYKKVKDFDSEARLSCMSSTSNEFFKTGMANYNPALEENKQLKKKILKLLEIRKEVEIVSSTKKTKRTRDDFGVYKKESELEIKKLQRNLEHVQTELDNAESMFSDTQSSFNKDYTEDAEEIRTHISTQSINLENRRKENRKKAQALEAELAEYYDLLYQDHGQDKKLRVRVRQLENELEQTLKKIDIVSRAKGFSKGRSSSKPKVERTQFRSGGRKPFGSNYSSPAYRSADRSKKSSPANLSNAASKRKISPGAVSTGSKKKKMILSNSSDKGSPGNRLYSPGGRPRDNSPTGGQRKPGAVQRVVNAFSPKDRGNIK